MVSRLDKWAVFFIALFASLTVLDSLTTYLGLTAFGLLEGDPHTKLRIESIGMVPGIILTGFVNPIIVLLTLSILIFPIRILPRLRNHFRSERSYSLSYLIIVSTRILSFMLLVGYCFFLIPTVINNYSLIMLGISFYMSRSINILSLVIGVFIGGVFAFSICLRTGEIPRRL